MRSARCSRRCRRGPNRHARRARGETDMRRIEVNGRTYRVPEHPCVVVCVDGCEPDYIAQAVAGGHMPWMKRVMAEGTEVIADCVMPSFFFFQAEDGIRDYKVTGVQT